MTSHPMTPRSAALNVLARRNRTAHDVATRLVRKGYEAGDAAGVVADLTCVGLINDEAFGRARARARAEGRLLGPRVVLADLIHQGVPRELAASIVREVYAEFPERMLAGRVIARFGGLGDRAARRRLHDRLARRGFSTDVIRDVMAHAIHDDEGGQWD